MAPKEQLKILLVDDNEFVLTAIQKLFEAANYLNVDCVKSAEAALSNMETAHYDLVITDVEMGKGEMNGLELLKEIRCGRAAIRKTAPIIVLTSYTDRIVIGTAIVLDANGFLAKPVRLDALIQKTQEAIKTKLYLRPAIAYDIIPCNAAIQQQTLSAEGAPKTVPDQNEAKTDAALDEASLQKSPQGDADASDEQEEVEAAPGTSSAPEPKGISVYSLRKGMKLVADIKATGGRVFVESGTVLTEQNVNQLRQMADILDTKFIKVEDEHKYMRWS